jgi:hypothetical protein
MIRSAKALSVPASAVCGIKVAPYCQRHLSVSPNQSWRSRSPDTVRRSQRVGGLAHGFVWTTRTLERRLFPLSVPHSRVRTGRTPGNRRIHLKCLLCGATDPFVRPSTDKPIVAVVQQLRSIFLISHRSVMRNDGLLYRVDIRDLGCVDNMTAIGRRRNGQCRFRDAASPGIPAVKEDP